MDDRGHCVVYSHPSRRDNAHIEKSVGSKKFICAPLRIDSKQEYDLRPKPIENTYEDLMAELMMNGFHSVMGENSKKPLLEIAKEKMNHSRHIQIESPLSLVEILSILIYTGSDAYRNLRYEEMLFWNGPLQHNPERVKDYYQNEEERKWPILSYTLSKAIYKLHVYDNKKRPMVTYHGLNNVEVDPMSFDCMEINKLDLTSTKQKSRFMYGSFVSTSTDKDIAISFMKSADPIPKGCLMEIELNCFCIGADVSWISKFPHEREFLIDKCQGFELKSNHFDAAKQYQIVQLTRIPKRVDLSMTPATPPCPKSCFYTKLKIF